MEEQKSTYSPGPYSVEPVRDSHDLDIVSSNRDAVARVMSNRSGHENAPEDAVALKNARLFQFAPRMRETIEVLLEREHEIMHPLVADAVRSLIVQIDHGPIERKSREQEGKEFLDTLQALREQREARERELAAEGGWEIDGGLGI